MSSVETVDTQKTKRNDEKETVVSVQGLVKVFKDFWGRPKAHAVNNVSFQVRKGEAGSPLNEDVHIAVNLSLQRFFGNPPPLRRFLQQFAQKRSRILFRTVAFNQKTVGGTGSDGLLRRRGFQRAQRKRQKAPPFQERFGRFRRADKRVVNHLRVRRFENFKDGVVAVHRVERQRTAVSLRQPEMVAEVFRLKVKVRVKAVQPGFAEEKTAAHGPFQQIEIISGVFVLRFAQLPRMNAGEKIPPP